MEKFMNQVKSNTITLSCGCTFDLNKDEKTILDFDNIRYNCPKTFTLLQEGLSTKGIFQLESQLAKTFCKRVKPSNIEQISDVISIIRPGALKSYIEGKSLAQHYVDRKNGKEEVKSFHPSLDIILSKTYLVMCYQEQIMEIAKQLAGFTLQEADTLRKGVGKKDAKLLASLKTKFIEGCKSVSILTEEQALEIFSWIQASARYLFNQSHAVSYAVSAYYAAYCKAHFPLQFFCAYLEYADDKMDTMLERRQLVDDAKNFNIEVRCPSLLDNSTTIHISGKNIISFGVANIKGTGLAILDKIKDGVKYTQEELGSPLPKWCWLEYLVFFTDRIPSQTNSGLIQSGACDWLGKSRQFMLFEYEIWNRLTDREKKYAKENLRSDLCETLRNLAENFKLSCKREELISSLVITLENPPISLKDTPDWIAWQEEKLLGISLTCHKVDGCEGGISATHTCKEVQSQNPKYAVVAAQIIRVKEVTTKNGKNPGSKMAFVDLSDGSFTMEGLPCFPDQWKEYKGMLQEENTLCVQVSKGERGFIIQKCWQI